MLNPMAVEYINVAIPVDLHRQLRFVALSRDMKLKEHVAEVLRKSLPKKAAK